tara:strand:+ start:6814 stop:7650 length:837 start_codon:yes stop_codon:yes gene_type:complete
MKKILVTGSNGFIAKNLISKIKKLEYNCFTVNKEHGDLAKSDSWKTITPCDYVIHLAARTFVPESWNSPDIYIRNNILTTTNALEYCKKNGSKMIFLSSYLYGNPKKYPIKEHFPLKATNPYALSKLLCEELCTFYSSFLNTDHVILRPFNIYGPNQPDYFLISNIIKQIKNSDYISIDSLSPKRDYLYIDDLSNAIIKTIKYEGKESIFNIGFGKSYSVEEVINVIQNVFGSKLPIINKNIPRKNEILNTLADIKLAKKELEWEPKYQFDEGIRNLL